jgi:hypothetical protein
MVMALTLTSISPVSGPPGTAVTLTGAGFDASSQAACPTLQPTAYVSATQLTVQIAADLAGPAGGSMAVGIYVVGGDGSTSGVQMFTVEFPAAQLQTWTTLEAVCSEVPGFQRWGQITDKQIQTWMTSMAQPVAAIMARRGLPINPALWPQPDPGVLLTPAGLLEMINRLGAAARLAAACASLFTQVDWAIRKTLQQAYDDECRTLLSGDYDRWFLATAATLETLPELAAGGMTDSDGKPDTKFRKDQEF